MPVLAKPDDACVTAQRCVKNSHHLKSLGKFGFVLPNYYQKLWQAQSIIVLALGLKNTDCVQIVTRPLAARQRPALVTIQRPQLLCHAGPNKRSLIARTRRDVGLLPAIECASTCASVASG